MRKIMALAALMLAAAYIPAAGITIEECVRKARDNYPLISKYGIVEATSDIELSDINKSWLPRATLYGQVTAQNAVPSFPESLRGMLAQTGHSMEGLGKVQYKAGLDISQTVWDGGNSRARRELQRRQADTERARLDVELYAVRQKVENLYFAILLTEEQIAQSRATLEVMAANLARMQAMYRNGVAMQSDVSMVEAGMLSLKQNIATATHALAGYRRVLGLYIGENIDAEPLEKPAPELPQTGSPERPELRLLAQRTAATEAAMRLGDTSTMPRIGLFAQTYYGYPGFDYFSSMANKNLSFNILAGIKVSWNIDALYTRRNTRHRSQLETEAISTERETFLFNTGMQTAAQTEAIAGLREVMKDDARIIELRKDVRRAAESQLANGIIDATDLLAKINDESNAALTARYHDIQLLQEIYNLKYTLNR